MARRKLEEELRLDLKSQGRLLLEDGQAKGKRGSDRTVWCGADLANLRKLCFSVARSARE